MRKNFNANIENIHERPLKAGQAIHSYFVSVKEAAAKYQNKQICDVTKTLMTSLFNNTDGKKSFES